jgi:hypothetical protein
VALFAYIIAALLQFFFYFYFLKLLVLPSLQLSNPEWTVDYIFYPVSVLASLVLSISVFKNAKKEFVANRIKKVSDLSTKLFSLRSQMDRETELFESWSKKQGETWKKIKTHLVDSYLASTYGKLLIKCDMAEQLLKPFWLGCVNPEQTFLPPSARPTDEQWLLALKPKIDAENELLKQSQSQIRDILLSRLAPDYETQQYELTDLDEKFIDLDLAKTDASCAPRVSR